MRLIILLLLFIPTLCFGQGSARHGSSLSYDGINDVSRTILSVTQTLDSATVEVRIKLNSINSGGGYSRLLLPTTSWLPGFMLVIYNTTPTTRCYWWDIGEGSAGGSTALKSGVWYDLASTWTKTNGTIKIILNGVQDGTANTAVTNTITISDYVGVNTFGTLNCNIGEVRIFSHNLSTTELLWNYNHPEEPYSTANLVCWWKADEFVGDTLHDYSGNNRHMLRGAGVVANKPTWSIETPIRGASCLKP